MEDEQLVSSDFDMSGENSRLHLLQELKQQNFDSIRFASYRVACKLRFIQKKVHLHNVDIWNIIEAFRENGLNTLDPCSTIGVSRLETLLSSLFHALNKRVPVSQQCNIQATTTLLLNWILAAYASSDNNKIQVFSVKVALATLCAGKLMDKFRYIYSQISDSNGCLIHSKFDDYLKEVLRLTAAVYESPSFSYTEDLSNTIFVTDIKVTVNDFLDTLLSDPGPNCLIWLPLYHRMATVELVIHYVTCDSCHTSNFTGFRYRCQKCYSYQLCQDCFWRGHVSGSHSNDHETKEYSNFKSPSRQIGHSLRKSFKCMPEKGKNNIPRFPDEPEKTLDLSHIVPPSPLPSHNGFIDQSYVNTFDFGSSDSRITLKSSEGLKLDDEHKLIARYAHRLAQEIEITTEKSPPETNQLTDDTSQAQREQISQLEAKNKEILREIARLRRQQEIEGSGVENPTLMNELRALRLRKDELESHLSALQDSRKQLMIQLESLMRMLKNHQSSPQSTPNSSPRSIKSPSLQLNGMTNSKSAPATPGGSLTNSMLQHQPKNSQLNKLDDTNIFQYYTKSTSNPASINAAVSSASVNTLPDNLTCLGGDVRSAFRTTALPSCNSINGNNCPVKSLRNDLLVAADSVTNAMSSLVRELNADSSDFKSADVCAVPITSINE
ncbi:dystrobrevin beta isoform X2 [Chelonus insularis]|nr:dystrobrevin beta isoform X2 [Chelonus insularis]XP_034944822.1 dystrobrevin beta isoform X2 [Chelonus insularis]